MPEEKAEVPEELRELEKLGVKEAWNIAKADLEDSVLVMAVPRDMTSAEYSAVAEELRRLLEALFPEEEKRPLGAIVPEDFKFALRNRGDTEDDIIDRQFRSLSEYFFRSPETAERMSVLNLAADKKNLYLDVGNENEAWRFSIACTELSRCKDCGRPIEVPRDGRCDDCIKKAYASFSED